MSLPEDLARNGSPEYINPRLDLLAHLRGFGYRLFTDAELRARDERIIRATDDHMSNVFLACTPDAEQIDAIIAAAQREDQ